MKNKKHYQNYKIIYYLLVIGLLNLVYIPKISANEVDKCYQDYEMNASELETPSPQLRNIKAKIKNVDLSFKIPSNYRTLLFDTGVEILSPSIYRTAYCAYRGIGETYYIFLENPYLGLFIALQSKQEYQQELNDNRQDGILVSINKFKLNDYIVETNITKSRDGFGCFIEYGIMKNSQTNNNIITIHHSYSFSSRKTQEDCSNITEKHEVLNQMLKTVIESLKF